MSLVLRSAARRLSRTFSNRNNLHTTPSCHVQTVLGIETSCDDTAAAILDTNGRILSHACHSQLKEHLHNGGIIPPIAKDLHAANIDRVISTALHQADMRMSDVDYIAVTNRPGLPLSLHVGVNFAKRLAIKYNKPIIPIHHMEAHALIGMLSHPELKFPFLVLLLSGGHAQIALVKDVNQFFLLGASLDDAPGETFDKIARRLKLRNLGHPFDEISGGAAIELMAKTGDPLKFYNTNTFIPLQKERSCDFSFSGFKNFNKLINRLEEEQQTEPDVPLDEAADIAASLQYLIACHIFKQLARAATFVERTRIYDKTTQVTRESLLNNYCDHMIEDTPENGLHLNIVLSGGVACSDYFASCLSRFCSSFKGYRDSTTLSAVIPRPKHLCSDNGIMIAWNAVLKLRSNNHDKVLLKSRQEIESLPVIPKVGLGTCVRDVVVAADIRPERIDRSIFPNVKSPKSNVSVSQSQAVESIEQ